VPLLYETYAVSEVKSVRVVVAEVGPWLVTVKVTEFLTGKPIEGATVQINGAVGTTGVAGTVTLTIEGGIRTIIVSKNGYWTKTGTRTIKEDTTIDVSLIPIWMIAAGGIGTVGLAGLIVWLWRKA